MPGCGRESGCRDVDGMCVMKYSWKQRRWPADGAMEVVGSWDAERLEAWAQMPPIGGPREALGR